MLLYTSIKMLNLGQSGFNCLHTCQPFVNFKEEIARKLPFLTDFLSKAMHAPKVIRISMGEMFGNFI